MQGVRIGASVDGVNEPEEPSLLKTLQDLAIFQLLDDQSLAAHRGSFG